MAHPLAWREIVVYCVVSMEKTLTSADLHPVASILDGGGL